MGFVVRAPQLGDSRHKNAATRDIKKAKFAFNETAMVHSFVLLHCTI
jgi:hypothetical protein